MEGSVDVPSTSKSKENMEEEDSVDIPSTSKSKENMEPYMEEEDSVNIPSTSKSEENMEAEESVNIPSTSKSEENMEDEESVNIPSTSKSKENMEEEDPVNIPSTSKSKENMEEEDPVNIPSTSKVNMEASSVWYDPQLQCSNCKAELKSHQIYENVNRVRISTLVDTKTAAILFPRLSPADFICIECVQMVKAKTTLKDNAKPRTLPGLPESTTPRQNVAGSANLSASKQKMGGSVNLPHPNAFKHRVPGFQVNTQPKQNTQGAVRYVVVQHRDPRLPTAPTPTPTTQAPIRYVLVPRLASVPTSNQNVQGSVNASPTSAQNIQACVTVNTRHVLVPRSGSAGTAPPTSKENMEEGAVKIPPTPPEQSMEEEEGAAANTPPASEENLVEGSAGRCSNCKAVIQSDKTKKHLNRRSIISFVDKHVAKLVFPHLSPSDFICMECVKILKSKTRFRSSIGKRVWANVTGTQSDQGPAASKLKSMETDASTHDYTNMISGCPSTSSVQHPVQLFYLQAVPQPPVQPPQAVRPAEPPPPPSPGKAKTGQVRQGVAPQLYMVLNNLKRRRYRKALRQLVQITHAKNAFIKVCHEVITKERKALLKDREGPYTKELTPENLSEFCWVETNEWVEEKAPVTMTCLRSMFPLGANMQGQHIVRNRGNEAQRTMTEEEAQLLVEKRIAMVMSIALYTGHKRRNHFVQSAIGVEMWREGCPPKMFTIMNTLGISQCRAVAKKNTDRIQVDHDKEVKLWKGELEKELVVRKKNGRYNAANPSYSLTWDCVKITAHAKQERIEQGKKPAIWAFRFAHQNRIPFNHLRDPPRKAVAVSPARILPSKQTYEALRQQMKIIVMRIIVDNLTAFKGLRKEVVRHIPHKYSQQMKEQSTVVNLGAVPVDSSPTEAVADIMDGFSEYVPTAWGKPHPVLYCGDGLNTDKVEPSRRAGPDGSAAEQTFEGLVEAPTEFHKESVCYQDMMKMLFSEKSLRARGSLSHIRKLFSHKKFLNCIKLKFQHVWDLDFITFVTSAYVTLYAATECNLDAVDQKPSDFPTDSEAQMEWLSGLSQRLVDLVWMPPPQEDINTAAATASRSEVKKNEVCFCGNEKPGEPLVQCCSNLCGGVWFHEGCAPIDDTLDPTVTQDWFCSPDCQGDGTYIYCYCKEQRGGQMVQCALMDQCKRHEWYHKNCLSPSERGNAEESTWYCSEACTIASDADDHVLNYTKAVVWEGLYNMARRDAVREGDGEGMTDFWKMDMVLFWARKHLKDFTICHRMLTGIEGFYPEHLRHDMKWNRVANIEGKPGGNVGLDLVSEFMNNEFKDSLGHVKGIYGNEKMELCTKMAGMLGNDVDRLFITGTGRALWPTISLPSSSFLKKRIKADIAKFLVEYKKDNLFRYVPGRAHQGFEKFTYQQKIKTPKKMGKTMRNLAQDMDLQS